MAVLITKQKQKVADSELPLALATSTSPASLGRPAPGEAASPPQPPSLPSHPPAVPGTALLVQGGWALTEMGPPCTCRSRPGLSHVPPLRDLA